MKKGPQELPVEEEADIEKLALNENSYRPL